MTDAIKVGESFFFFFLVEMRGGGGISLSVLVFS